MQTNQADTVRMAGMRLGMKPAHMQEWVGNPREITARLRYQQTYTNSP